MARRWWAGAMLVVCAWVRTKFQFRPRFSTSYYEPIALKPAIVPSISLHSSHLGTQHDHRTFDAPPNSTPTSHNPFNHPSTHSKHFFHSLRQCLRSSLSPSSWSPRKCQFRRSHLCAVTATQALLRYGQKIFQHQVNLFNIPLTLISQSSWSDPRPLVLRTINAGKLSTRLSNVFRTC